MYIQPNSTIKLLSDVPINKNQTDTLYFETVADQTAYFNTKVVATFPANTYQRVNRGRCRIAINADSVYNVNYMMFQNASYSLKWFYAFVDTVEYINDSTTEITFTIDPVQTWFFNYTTGECFVERETTITDRIGDHIEPENLGLGEYVLNGDYEAVCNQFIDQCIIVAWEDPQNTVAVLHDGVMCATQLLAYECTASGIQDLQTFIASQVQAPDNIKNIYMCPKALIGNIPASHVIPSGSSGVTFFEDKTPINAGDLLDGYLPLNNKMYTYPYTFYHVDAPNGQALALRYELFKDLTPSFKVSGNITTPVEIACMPVKYKNSKAGTDLSAPEEYRLERLSIKGIPMCNWSTDYYANWLAQNSIPILVNNATALGVAIGTGNPAIGALGVAQIAHTLTDFYRSSIQADISRGSYETGSNDYANHRDYFKGARMSVNKYFAARIDSYFTCFGYNVSITKVPNRKQRTRFTYLKTIDCNVYGDLPSDDAKYIADCYNNGIRFWLDHSAVGDYTLKNEPLQQTP